MSLEAAAKELERLEIQMQKTSDKRSSNSGSHDEKKSKDSWEGTACTTANAQTRERHRQLPPQQHNRIAENNEGGGGEQRWQRLGAEGPAEGDTTGDSGSNCEIRGKEFETYFSENDSGRRSTQQQGESFERRQAGGFGRETTGRTAREGSPTRVHVRRTGSVEIEHGTGSGGAGGDFFFEPTARTASRHTADTRNVGGDADGGERDDIFDTARFSHFDRGGGSSGDRYSAAGAASGDAPFCSRESRWRLERLDGGSGGDGRRSLRGTWDSSVGGAVGPATGGTAAAAAAAARGATRIRDWRTEADADLSDIKATMQRLDGSASISATSMMAGGPRYNAGGGSGGGDGSSRAAFGLDPVTSRPNSASAAAAAAVAAAIAHSTTANTATAMDRRDGSRSSNPAISGIRDGIRSNPSTSRPGEPPGGTSGLYSSVGGETTRAMGWGASSGSKAVLTALRSLQDKIRNLESERDRATVEASTLRRQITALQSETERTAQVNLAGEQETRLASRLAYERLQADKNAADIRLRKVEEQKQLLLKETEAAKARSQAAEVARRAAESRVSTLEDRLLGLGRREEADTSAEVRERERNARRRQEKDGQLKDLKAKVARMEAAVTAEISLRKDAENGLAGALAAKRQTERFLSGILKVNEELVKNAVAVGGSGVSAAAIKKTAKTKRTTKASKAAAIRRNGKGRPASASLESHPQPPPPQPPPPPPPPSRHGGHVDSAEFNVGTYTAKRAKTRARQVSKSKRKVDAKSTATLCIACESDTRQRAQHTTATSQRKSSISRASTAQKAASTETPRGTRISMRSSVPSFSGGRVAAAPDAVPFVASGKGQESYNVVSAVSKAMRTARKGRPRESLDRLYADLGAAVLNSTNDVPFMFQRQRRPPSATASLPPRRGKKKRSSSSAVATVARDRGARGRGTVRSTAGGRAVLDVAMPDMSCLNLASEPSSPTSQHHHDHYNVSHRVETAVSEDAERVGTHTASLPEYWNQGWDEAEDRGRRSRAGRREASRGAAMGVRTGAAAAAVAAGGGRESNGRRRGKNASPGVYSDDEDEGWGGEGVYGATGLQSGLGHGSDGEEEEEEEEEGLGEGGRRWRQFIEDGRVEVGGSDGGGEEGVDSEDGGDSQQSEEGFRVNGAPTTDGIGSPGA